MKCIFCEKEFEAKRETAKYCSTNCRVKWHNKFGGAKKNEVKPFALQVLLGRVMDRLDKFEANQSSPITLNEPKQNKSFYNEPLPWDSPKTKIKRSQAYFEKIIMDGGCLEPEDHKAFIQEVNESDLPDIIKTNLIVSSRVKQS